VLSRTSDDDGDDDAPKTVGTYSRGYSWLAKVINVQVLPAPPSPCERVRVCACACAVCRVRKATGEGRRGQCNVPRPPA
jgi:hypothetical protein